MDDCFIVGSPGEFCPCLRDGCDGSQVIRIGCFKESAHILPKAPRHHLPERIFSILFGFRDGVYETGRSVVETGFIREALPAEVQHISRHHPEDGQFSAGDGDQAVFFPNRMGA